MLVAFLLTSGDVKAFQRRFYLDFFRVLMANPSWPVGIQPSWSNSKPPTEKKTDF